MITLLNDVVFLEKMLENKPDLKDLYTLNKKWVEEDNDFYNVYNIVNENLDMTVKFHYTNNIQEVTFQKGEVSLLEELTTMAKLKV